MKITPLIRMLPLWALVGTIASCSKENPQIPLQVHYVEGNTLELYYPALQRDAFTIVGGDGVYSYECTSPLLTLNQTYSNTIRIDSIGGVGDALVLIKDNSGSTYDLHVKIDYRQSFFVIANSYITITGDGLTQEQTDAIRADALKTIPYQKTRYLFVYKELGTPSDGSVQRGEVAISGHDMWGGTTTKYPFEYSFSTNPLEERVQKYKIIIDGQERVFNFVPNKSNNSRTSPPTAGYNMVLAEDLTHRYKAAYPAVQQVASIQIIDSLMPD